ncbi:MAG: NlpC/P60 family protein [Thermodesulfobacteriota bacterium]
MGINLADLAHTPFQDGGRDPRRGLDCWGLVMEVLRRFGSLVPDYGAGLSAFDSAGIAAIFETVTLPPGDKRGQEPFSPGVNEPPRFMAEKAPVPFYRVDESRPGDVAALAIDARLPGLVQHFGVVLDGGRFIHVLKKQGVCCHSLGHPWLGPKIKGFYRWTR